MNEDIVETLREHKLELIDPPIMSKGFMAKYAIICKEKGNGCGAVFKYNAGYNLNTRKLILYPDKINLLGSIQVLFDNYGFLKDDLADYMYELFWDADCHTFTCLHHFATRRGMSLEESISEVIKLGLADSSKLNRYILYASESIPKDEIQYGDFIFFKDKQSVKHSAIYVGSVKDSIYLLSRNGSDLFIPYSFTTLSVVMDIYTKNHNVNNVEFRRFSRDKPLES